MSASGDFVPHTSYRVRPQVRSWTPDPLFRGAPKILKLYSGPIQSLNGIPSQPAGNSAWAERQRAIYSPYQANIGLLNLCLPDAFSGVKMVKNALIVVTMGAYSPPLTSYLN